MFAGQPVVSAAMLPIVFSAELKGHQQARGAFPPAAPRVARSRLSAILFNHVQKKAASRSEVGKGVLPAMREEVQVAGQETCPAVPKLQA